MNYRHLQLKRDGHVLICRLSNPPAHTLNNTGVGELHQLLDSVASDTELRVLVLTGAAPGIFIAHYELNDVLGMLGDAEQGSREGSALPLHPYHQFLNRLEALPIITLAAISGNAAGGGLELALCCDFRVMVEGDFLTGLPETNNGIIPGAGGTQRLTRLLGEARALEMILLGRMLSPKEAMDWGLIHTLYPAADFEAKVASLAQRLARRAPVALREAKAVVRAAATVSLQQGLALEQQAFYRCLLSEDATGAIQAWLRGQAYTFTGK